MSSVATICEHTFLTRRMGPTSVVLDLGANLGLFSAAMVQQYRCLCHAVEPNPAMRRQIPDDPHIRVHPFAMSGARGEATFHVSTDPLGSSLNTTDELDYTETITVQTETLAGLMDGYGIRHADLLKADIEGGEIAMFDAASDADLHRVDQFTVEFHDFNGTTPVADVLRVLERFRDLGFTVYRKARFAHFDVLILHPERVGVSQAELAWIRTGRHYLTGVGRLARKAVGGV